MIPRISSISSACGGIVSNLYISGLDNSTCKIQFTLLLNFESHYVRQYSPTWLRMWDNSTFKFHCTALVKFESHLNLGLTIFHLEFVGEVDSSHIYIAILKCSGYPLTSWIPCIA